jgi:hypothetical protein
VSGAINADGSYTAANGQTYDAGVVNRVQNASGNDVYANDYYQQKYGQMISPKTAFGMPVDVENGTQQDVRNWIDGLGAPTAAPSTGAPSPAPAPASSGGGSGIVAGGRGNSNYTAWKVTPEQTVEGRIQSIINPNNPIIASARADAVDEMNARGLSNSTLATTAADKAAFAAAIPIAQADAATFAKAGGYNADIQNQMAMQKAQLANQLGIAGLQSDTQKQIAQLNADTQKYTAGLDAQTRTTLQDMQNKNQLVIQTNSQAATIFNQAVAAISQLQNNDKMDATSKTQAIAQIIQNVNNQLSAMSKAAGVDVAMNLSNYPGFDANGNYVGFGSTGQQPPPTNPFTGVPVNDYPGG